MKICPMGVSLSHDNRDASEIKDVSRLVVAPGNCLPDPLKNKYKLRVELESLRALDITAQKDATMIHLRRWIGTSFLQALLNVLRVCRP
jgi:hypothetical protein